MANTMQDKGKRAPQAAPTPARTREIADEHEAALAAVDELLDEIDEVLEANASEVLQRYRQRGGE